jgi:hypothetical protein
MASADWKDAIVDYFHYNIKTNANDWKRVKKARLPNGETYREFYNAVVDRTVYCLGDEEETTYILEKDVWLYGVYNVQPGEEMFPGVIGDLMFSFEPQDRWNRNKHIYDQHQQHLLEAFFANFPAIGEDMENSFSYEISAYNSMTIHMALKKAGFVHSQEITDFLNRTGNPGAPLPPTSPSNPPQPTIFGASPTSNSTPAPAAPTPQAPPQNNGPLGGYYGTGLEEDGSAKASDFLAVVGEDDGEVQVWITPMMAYARKDPFDSHVGGLVDHLLPAEWQEASEQTFEVGSLSMVEAFDYLLKAGFQVDWPEYKREAANHIDVYDVTLAQHQANLAAIANPQTVAVQHHHNPIPVGPQNANFIELTGQEPAVQTALEAARALGVKGLEQEGKWDDQEEIEEKWEKSYYLNNYDGFIELERSHALWLLYEHYDNGSGLAWPNFFGMDNIRVASELFKIMDLDLGDGEWEEDYSDGAEHPIVIIDDHQSYPAPYDLPVPAYVPPPVQVIPPAIQTSKVPPKSQPANAPRPSFKGPVTGSGSFAPVSSGPVAKADVDDTPVDATYIRHDAGDQWPEFCGEVWDNYSQNGAGAISWSDRFRLRHARIIGLGYKFKRVEFTGILVQMGYLNDKFEIINDIDLPGAVFDELFVDFGGDWNDDENVQMINKRKGEDPETGFSYSSQNLWAEIEPLLKSKGWFPAK